MRDGVIREKRDCIQELDCEVKELRHVKGKAQAQAQNTRQTVPTRDQRNGAIRSSAEVIAMMMERRDRIIQLGNPGQLRKQDASFRGFADYMQTPVFGAHLRTLMDMAHAGDERAIMCAEAVPWRCHRFLIADALTLRGVRVQHLIGADTIQIHIVTPWARLVETDLTYPPPESGS